MKGLAIVFLAVSLAAPLGLATPSAHTAAATAHGHGPAILCPPAC